MYQDVRISAGGMPAIAILDKAGRVIVKKMRIIAVRKIPLLGFVCDIFISQAFLNIE
jgi:hypothetical protein